MGQADYLELGTWNAICAVCGRKFKANRLMRLPVGVPGAGMYACPEHWDARQPQDYVRGVQDNMTPPWIQPEADSFLYSCDYITISAYAGIGVAGCAQAGHAPVLTEVIDWVA